MINRNWERRLWATASVLAMLSSCASPRSAEGSAKDAWIQATMHLLSSGEATSDGLVFILPGSEATGDLYVSSLAAQAISDSIDRDTLREFYRESIDRLAPTYGTSIAGPLWETREMAMAAKGTELVEETDVRTILQTHLLQETGGQPLTDPFDILYLSDIRRILRSEGDVSAEPRVVCPSNLDFTAASALAYATSSPSCTDVAIVNARLSLDDVASRDHSPLDLETCEVLVAHSRLFAAAPGRGVAKSEILAETNRAQQSLQRSQGDDSLSCAARLSEASRLLGQPFEVQEPLVSFLQSVMVTGSLPVETWVDFDGGAAVLRAIRLLKGRPPVLPPDLPAKTSAETKLALLLESDHTSDEVRALIEQVTLEDPRSSDAAVGTVSRAIADLGPDACTHGPSMEFIAQALIDPSNRPGSGSWHSGALLASVGSSCGIQTTDLRAAIERDTSRTLDSVSNGEVVEPASIFHE